MANETTSAEPTEATPRPAEKRRPYRTPEVVTRPLFERMALGCQDPELGDPY